MICKVCKGEIVLDGNVTRLVVCPSCKSYYSFDEGMFLSLGEVVNFNLERREVTFKLDREEDKEEE